MVLRQNRRVDQRLVLLAPRDAVIPGCFQNIYESAPRHEKLLRGLQKLRGRLYLEDGAIRPDQLASDGAYRLAVDDRSWHVLALSEEGEVCGCARYRAHANTVPFSKLAVGHAAIAASPEWGALLRVMVSRAMEQARNRRVAFVEVGGWALAPEVRRTREALRIALGTYGLAQLLGGCVGITTATSRHRSAEILQGLGGQPLGLGQIELPPYYDPQYQCEMQVLCFDSSRPNPRYQAWIDELAAYWQTAPVILPQARAAIAASASAPLRTIPSLPAWKFGQTFAHAVQ